MMRWLLTYADMITLMLALFIILFSISTINKVKLQRARARPRRRLQQPGRDQQPAQRHDDLGDQRRTAGDASSAAVLHQFQAIGLQNKVRTADPARGQEARAGHRAAQRQAALRQRLGRAQAGDRRRFSTRSDRQSEGAVRTTCASRATPTTCRSTTRSSRELGTLGGASRPAWRAISCEQDGLAPQPDSALGLRRVPRRQSRTTPMPHRAANRRVDVVILDTDQATAAQAAAEAAAAAGGSNRCPCSRKKRSTPSSTSSLRPTPISPRSRAARSSRSTSASTSGSRNFPVQPAADAAHAARQLHPPAQ